MNYRLLAFSGLMLVLLTWGLLAEFGIISPLWSASLSSEYVGRIKSVNKSVSIRKSQDLYWTNARAEDGLQYYDSLLTLDDSTTQIELIDGSVIQVEPNTLVVLEPLGDGRDNLKLTLNRGDLNLIKKAPFTLIVEEDEPAQPQETAHEFAQRKLSAMETLDESTEIQSIDLQKRVRNWSVWFGTGGNYLIYTQTIANFTDASYQSLSGPSFFLRTSGMLNENYGLDFSLKDSPGQVTSSQTIPVSNGDYQWLTFTAEGFRQLTSDATRLFGIDTLLNLRLGLQEHAMPFIAAQESGGAEIRQNYLTMASGGIDFVLGKKRKLRYEFMGRYQYPIFAGASGGNKFAVSPIWALDGSMGVAYRLSEPFLLGLYWYGQWHRYNFTYFDSAQGVENNGYQSLFYSNAELRFGWEF